MNINKFSNDDMINVIETYPPNHPAHIAAMRQMIDSLPKTDRDRFHKDAMAILGNPEPDGYDMHGDPIYRADTLARCSGIPLAEVEEYARENEKLFGQVEIDEKVTVLKQPEVEYIISSSDAVLLSLIEWSEGNPKVIPMLTGWFDLAIERGLKPIVIEQLKNLIKHSDFDVHAVNKYLERIYKFTQPDEFLIKFMGVKPLEA